MSFFYSWVLVPKNFVYDHWSPVSHKEPQNPSHCLTWLTTRSKFGFEYFYMIYSFFSMGRILKLSRTTLPWNTRRKANQQAWWRTRSRSGTSTTAPGTRSPSTLTLTMVSMHQNGLGARVAVLPFRGEEINTEEEQGVHSVSLLTFVSIALSRFMFCEKCFPKPGVYITAVLWIRHTTVNADPSVNTGGKTKFKEMFLYCQEHTFKNFLDINQAWLHQAHWPCTTLQFLGEGRNKSQSSTSVNGDIFAPTLKKFEIGFNNLWFPVPYSPSHSFPSFCKWFNENEIRKSDKLLVVLYNSNILI